MLLIGVAVTEVMMTSRKTAITIDPSGFFRDGLESCLVKAGFRPLSHALSLAEAVRDLAGRTPGVAAVGPNFTEPEAFAISREMLARWPNVQIILYTGHAADRLVQADAFHTGLQAVLPREAGEAETLATIARIEAGLPMFTQEIHASRLVAPSPRELDALKLMAEGTPDTEIAHKLNVSYSTARTYAQRILQKLNVHERREAVRRGRRLGWLPPK